MALFLCYANSLQNGFVSDDYYIIEQNQDTLSLPSLLRAFTRTAGLIDTDGAPYYRPVHRVSYLFDKYFFGLRPLGYHVVNLMLHAVTVCLLYILLLRLGCTTIAAFGAALLFGLHPVNAETVDFISARNDLLAVVLVLAAFHVFLTAEERRLPAGYALSGFLFFLGMLSKESAVMFLPFLVVFKLFRDRPWTAPRSLRSWDVTFLVAPVIGLSLYLVLRSLAVDDAHLLNKLDGLSGRLEQLAFIIPSYASLLVAPVRLNFHYTVPSGPPFPFFPPAVTFLCLLAVTGYAYLRRNRLIALGLLWCAINFIPISNILPLPSAPMAERYLYMPLIGISTIIAGLFHDLRCHVRTRHLPVLLMLSAAVPLGIATNHRNLTWKDDLSVARAIADANPSYATGQFDFGFEAYRQGDSIAARQAFNRSLLLDRTFLRASWAEYYLGAISMEEPDPDTALRSWRNAIASDPGNSAAHYALAALSAGRAPEASPKLWQNVVGTLSLPAYPLLLEALDHVRDGRPLTPEHRVLNARPTRPEEAPDHDGWQLFHRYGTGTAFYYDPASAHDAGIDRTVLTMQQLSRDDARAYASRIIRFPLTTLSSVRFLLTINCRQHLYKTASIEFRDDKSAVLGSIRPDAEAMLLYQYIPQDTPLRTLADLVCTRNGRP